MSCAQAVSLTSPAFRSVALVELRQSLPGRIAIISPFVDQLMHFIARLRNPDGGEFHLEAALHEALAMPSCMATRRTLTSSSAPRAGAPRRGESPFRLKTSGKDLIRPRY